MKERKLLKIEYLDHVSLEHGEDGIEKIRKAEPLICTAYGELLKETPVFVTILHGYDNKGKGFTHKDLRASGVLILKSCITERKELVPK